MKLDCIDTFSGIGGISIGLQDFAHTIQYCEWDAFCQQVLVERMEEGRLERAPIHADIKTLHISPRVQPRMICGGFPCQDISSLGLQKGIAEGERSSMFYHVMRIVDECPSIDVIFLENVSNIVNCGLKEVVDECTKRGFNMQWKMFTAGEMGAPHVRARWFCLICKPGVDLTSLDLQPKVGNHWQEEPATRITYKPTVKVDDTFDANWIQRCQTLGNSVVPQVVREAFVDLASSSTKWHMIADCLSQFRVPLETLQYPYPESGLIFNNVFYTMPKRIPFQHKHAITITMGNGDQVLGNYPTPRRGLTHASSLTERSIRDLPTVLVHCDQTKKVLQDDGFTDTSSKLHTIALPNVNYIEWMMGYPKDWTKIKSPYKQKHILQSHVAAVEEDDATTVPASPKEKQEKPVVKARLNGMHALMKEHPGKDIRYIANIWRSLSNEEKKVYSEKAKLM